jgi:hypothetical protein
MNCFKIITLALFLICSTAANPGDTIILASGKGLFFKYADAIKPLVYFDNFHQEIKDKAGTLDFNFVPRSIEQLADNVFMLGGMWGGLYQVDILNNKLSCFDDINYNKIKVVDLSEL